MLPHKHFFLGAIFSIFVFLIIPSIGVVGLLVIFGASFLIDVDHYVFYVFKKRDLSLIRAYKWYIKMGKKFLALSRKQREKVHGGVCFLHGVEILALLVVLGFFWSKIFLFIFAGFGFHMLLDSADQTRYQDKIFKLSLFHDIFRFKKTKFIEET